MKKKGENTVKILEQLSNSFRKKKTEKREIPITLTSDSILSKMLSQKTDIAFSSYGGYSVLEIPALMACMNKITSSVGQLPLDVYIKNRNGKEPDVESSLSYILKNRPNENMTPTIFKKYIVNQLFIYGECFARVIRSQEGKIKAIEPAKRGTLTYIVESNKRGLYYRYFYDKVELKPQERINLLHFRENLNNDGNPMSPLTRLTETIGMDKGTTKFLQEYLNNMVSPSFILEIDSDLSMEKANAIGDAFRKGIVGSHGAPLVIQKGLSAKEFNAKSLKDLDISLLREKSSRDIVTALGCPLHTVGLNVFSREAEVAFFENIIMPILTNIEEELNYKLFAREESKVRFIRFNVKRKMRGNMTERIAYYDGLFKIGAITQNEIRALEDMNEVEGGDTPLILENYLPTDMLDKQGKLN